MCDYCEGTRTQEEWDFKMSVRDYFLLVEHKCSECGDSGDVQFVILYCPMCGKKL